MRQSLTPIVFVAIMALTACDTHKSNEVAASKNDSTTQINQVQSVSVNASEILAKFKDTEFRRDKLARGILNYDDTTFNNQMFVIRDTISDIGVDNSGNDYIILGRGQGEDKQDIKCYFTDKKDIGPLKVNQVVTVRSKKHIAVVRTYKLGKQLQIMVVTMGHCSLIN